MPYSTFQILIDGYLSILKTFFHSIARGQKIPIFSAAGLPHNEVSLYSIVTFAQ